MEQQEYTYIKEVLDGKINSFAYFTTKYSSQVYLLILKIVRNKEDAEELTQDVFIKAYKTLSGFKGDSKFSTWIYRIAYNTAISFTRKKKIEFLYNEEESINNIPDEVVDYAFENYAGEGKIQQLATALEKLGAEERALITLFYMEKKTIEEIALITSISQGNVKVKLHRTRKKLYTFMYSEQ